MEFEKGESEYDVRQGKLGSINSLIDRLNFYHYRCTSGRLPDEDKGITSKTFYKHFKGILRVLFFEARMYSNDEELIEDIEELFEIYEQQNVDKLEVLEDLRLKVGNLMQDGGLDLPRKNNVDPEEAYREGL